jgi:arylsulfatase A-like enzyme
MNERHFLLRGLLGGLAWGAAVAITHLGHGIGLILVLGQPPLTWFAAKGTLVELVLGVVAGLVLSPLYKLPKGGEFAHPAALCALWLVVERIVAVDPSKPLMWIAPSVVALVFVVLGMGVWRRLPALVIGTAVVTPVVLLAAPEIRTAMAEKEAPPELKPAKAGAPDVLFIVMDTTRSQSLSTHGYHRDTTPVLERLAAEGLLFEGATAPSTWSLPAHAALFTGTFPSFNNAHAETRMLGKTFPTIAEVFADAGYVTHCFSANPHISEAFGLTRGFHYSDKAWMAGPGARQFSFIYRFLDYLGLGVDDKGGALVVDNIEQWWEERPDDGPPAFVFVNFLEAHFPFHQLPREYVYAYQDRPMSELREAGQIAFGAQFGRPLTAEEVEQIRGPLVDLYDGGIKYTDFLVGEVVDQWRERGKLDDTIVVVLGDHGEVVGEHDAFGHVTAMVEEDLRVPLIFRYPKAIPGGTRVEGPVSTVGTFATLTELAGIEHPKVHVTSLLPALQGRPVGQPVIAERFEEHLLAQRFAPGTSNGKGPLVNPRGRYRTFRKDDWKYVLHSDGGEWLYDLANDPGELNDLASSEWQKLDELKEDLAFHAEELLLPELDAEVTGEVMKVEDMDEATKKQLCELGYLSGDDCN